MGPIDRREVQRVLDHKIVTVRNIVKKAMAQNTATDRSVLDKAIILLVDKAIILLDQIGRIPDKIIILLGLKM
jgi:hypothetical protein